MVLIDTMIEIAVKAIVVETFGGDSRVKLGKINIW